MARRSPTTLSIRSPQGRAWLGCSPAVSGHSAPPLTIDQLEEGLRQLDCGEIEPNLFWDENIVAFRQTVLVAIRDTADALACVRLSDELRAELQSQVEPLNYYLRMADCYLAKRRRRLN